MIVVVEVEDQPTGSFSISGGYSTTDGAIAEVSVTETNFLGRGQYVKLSASEGQYSRGWSATFTEPYFLDQRIAAGFDIYHKETDPYQYALLRELDDGRDPAPRPARSPTNLRSSRIIRSTNRRSTFPNEQLAAL